MTSSALSPNTCRPRNSWTTSFADCNQNGLLDSEIADGQGDCDGDGELDECSLINNDCDSNSVPDQCDPDCNSNGIAEGTSADCQPDGVLDECQLDVETNLFYDIGFGIIAWRADVPYMAWLNRFNVEEGGTLYGIGSIMPAGTVVPVWFVGSQR